jgi:transcriptional regulator with GAF, ATPase, and Fis domain
MARDLAAQSSVRETLDRIVSHAVALVEGCEAAGVMVVHRGQVETLAASDNMVTVSDQLQSEFQEGPCFDATRNRHDAYRITDMHSENTRWPQYAKRARELGIGSTMGFLLYTDDERNLGALDLYSSQVDAFGKDHEHVGWLLAAHAAVALSSAQHVAHLNDALETRQLIGQAVGVLMSRHKLTERQAWERLTRTSQNTNVKVRDLAETILYTGDLPERRP